MTSVFDPRPKVTIVQPECIQTVKLSNYTKRVYEDVDGATFETYEVSSRAISLPKLLAVLKSSNRDFAAERVVAMLRDRRPVAEVVNSTGVSATRVYKMRTKLLKLGVIQRE